MSLFDFCSCTVIYSVLLCHQCISNVCCDIDEDRFLPYLVSQD